MADPTTPKDAATATAPPAAAPQDSAVAVPPVAAPPAEAAAPSPAPAVPDPGAQVPAAASASATEAAAAPAEVPAREPSLLQKFDAEQKTKAEAKPAEPAKPDDKAKEPVTPADAKPAEASKPDDKKPAEAAKAPDVKPEPAKPEPVDYKYTVPETIKLDDATRGELHAALDAFRANPAEGAQGLIALHEKAMQDYAEHLSREQHRLFNDTRKAWNTDVMADDEVGGAGHQTAMGAVARMRDMFTPPEMLAPRKWPDGSARPSQFDEFLETTGAGDHLVFIKMLHRAARYFDEPGLPPRDIQPPANNGRDPAARRKLVYDHPRSPGNRQ